MENRFALCRVTSVSLFLVRFHFNLLFGCPTYIYIYTGIHIPKLIYTHILHRYFSLMFLETKKCKMLLGEFQSAWDPNLQSNPAGLL